ncbi:MAG: hypothetical protein JWQ02_41 [Capsulimonas sp.]|jgi:hypothetical protein|nr:hypothetical protein [Capsulimonas sp.]
MKLINFHIVGKDGIGIEVEAFGVLWNLHDSYLTSISQNILGASVRLAWENYNYQGDSKYPAYQFAIDCYDVHQFEISARDPEMPRDEDSCLDFISGVPSPAILAETMNHSYSPMIAAPSDFLLFLTFRGGQRILIGAERAEFILLDS